MHLVQMILAHGDAILGIVSMALSLAVAIAHLAHKENVASSIESLEKIVEELKSKPEVKPEVPAQS
jgi:hypothetical protein